MRNPAWLKVRGQQADLALGLETAAEVVTLKTERSILFFDV